MVLSHLFHLPETAVSGIWNVYEYWPMCLEFFTKREASGYVAENFGTDQ